MKTRFPSILRPGIPSILAERESKASVPGLDPGQYPDGPATGSLSARLLQPAAPACPQGIGLVPQDPSGLDRRWFSVGFCHRDDPPARAAPEPVPHS